ncbi:MAG: serine hydrolase domain-containing protein [Bacteroidota bacterium]|nr:serine hydrolase domain-containing protein [Bacteroidota bacterium]
MKFSRIFIQFITPFFLLGCNGGAKPQSQTSSGVLHLKTKSDNSYVTDFEKFVQNTMAETHIPGAAIAIVKDTNIVLLKGYGVKTFGTTDSVDAHTVFRIASVSKGFASMLAGILVQEKSLNWDDKVVKYLPYFKLKDEASTNRLTIRHILSHTSGLPVHTFTNKIEEGVPYSVLKYSLSTVKLASPVGTSFAYQNVAYSLISDIAQASTKKTYETLLREKIFKPLGMIDASASYTGLKTSKNLALPHVRRDSTKYRLISNTPEYYSVLPAAGVNASISDMAKWLVALLGGRTDVISAKTLSEIYKPEINTPRRRKYEFYRWPNLKTASYGLGWRVLNYNGETLIYHGGHINGYRSEVAFCPSERVGVVILTNASGKLANDGVEMFFDDYFASQRALDKQ